MQNSNTVSRSAPSVSLTGLGLCAPLFNGGFHSGKPPLLTYIYQNDIIPLNVLTVIG